MASNNNAPCNSNAAAIESPSTEILFTKDQNLDVSPSTGDLHISFTSTSEYASDGETSMKKQKTPPGLVGYRPATAIESDVTFLSKSMAMTDIAGNEAEVATSGQTRFTNIRKDLGSYNASASTMSLGAENSAESMDDQLADAAPQEE